MNNKVKAITVSIIIMGIGASVWFYKHKNSKSITPPTGNEVLEDDLKVLKDSKGATQYQIYAALVRLAQSGNQIAYEQALQRYKDPQPWVRAGVGLALSYFSTEEADRIIQTLVNDPEAIVREKTFEGLSFNSENPQRFKMLTLLLNEKNRPPLEKIQLKIALLRHGSDVNAKNQILKEITGLLKEIPVEKKIAVIQSLVALESRNEILGSYLKILLETEKKSPELTAVAVNALSIAQPEKIKDHLATYIRSEHENIRIAAVNGFLYSCPPGVINTLNDLIKNDKSDLVVKTSLQVLSGFPRGETKKIFESLKDKKFSQDMSRAYKQAYLAFETNKGNDPCQR